MSATDTPSAGTPSPESPATKPVSSDSPPVGSPAAKPAASEPAASESASKDSPSSTDLAIREQPPPPLSQPPPLPEPVWPGPEAPAGSVPPIAAAVTGVLAAAFVPLGQLGVGWVLAGLVAAVAIVVSLWRRVSWSWERAAWGIAALALLSVGALRAAEWLFALCLLGAAVAIVLALTNGRTLLGLLIGGLLVPAALVRGVSWGQRSIAARWRSQTAESVRIGPTIVITAAVLLIFGALFASADAVFSRLLGTALPDLTAGSITRWVFLFGVAGAFVLGAVYLLIAPPTVDDFASAQPRRVKLIEWAVPVGALVALFASFVSVQLTVLFGGVTYVLGPDGPTYAEYARGGFWQLLVVTALTLLVIWIVAALAPRETPVERWFLRGLLGALAALTLVIVASALFRMHTYQEAYGFTRLRVLVSVMELWLGLVFLLVMAAGIRLRAAWLLRAVAATGIAALLGLAVLNPDRFIAERNLERWEAGKQLDYAYLTTLSDDAVPALVCRQGPPREVILPPFQDDAAELSTSDWRRANLARAIAADLLADPPENC